MSKMILGACARGLDLTTWKLTYFDTTAVVSKCTKMMKSQLVLLDLVSLESKYVSTSQIGVQLVIWKINYTAQDNEWHNLGNLINFCWTNFHQSYVGGCTDYADHNPHLKCVKCFKMTQPRLCHQRATRYKFVILMWGMGFMAPVQCIDKLTSQMESPNTDRKTSSDEKPWFWIFYDQMKFNWHQNSNTSHTEHAKHVCKVRCPKCANVTQPRLCHLEGFCNFFSLDQY